MLGALGLSPQEESVYRSLLGRSHASCDTLAAELELTPAETALALGRLAEHGLATALRAGEFAAAPPAVALGSLISERRWELRTAEMAVAAFAEEHRATAAGRSVGELIEVVTGADAMRQRFLQVQHAAHEEVRSFVRGPIVAVSPGESAAEHTGMTRGVRYRVVVERAILAEPGVLAETMVSLRDGAHVRVADTLPMKLIIADSDLALVLLTVAGDEPCAVLLHRSGLLAALDALFELVWRQSYPLELEQLDSTDGQPPTEQMVEHPVQDGPTELDRRILTLLLSGLSDQAAAGQLDISLRTLQRRLRLLMDLAGVDTRMKLGWHAARHDWA